MRTKLILGLIIIASILSCVIIYQRKQINKQDIEIGSLTNNVRAYENMEENNRVLQLKLSDLRDSKDKLIHSLDSTRNALKLSKKDLKHTSAVKTKIEKEVDITIPKDTSILNCDFSVNKYLNSETSVSVSRTDSIVKVKLIIKNTQYLFVYSSKEWRNNRKNWFDRLFHWDWKKDAIFRYEIENSNPLIEVEDTRIIEIKE